MKRGRKSGKTAQEPEKAGRRRTVLAGVLSLGSVWAVPCAFCPEGEWLSYTNSIWAFFLSGGLFFLLIRALDAGASKEFSTGFSRKRSVWLFPGLFGTLFCICMAFGSWLDKRGSVPFGSGRMWAGILVLSVTAALLTRCFWEAISRKSDERSRNPGATGEETVPLKKKIRRLLLRAAVIFACYLPVFLAVYPGFFVYDAQDEYLQVATRNFSTHHPLLHVLLLGGVIRLVDKLTGSVNLGIACYTLLQMGAMSLIFAGCVEVLRARGLKRSGQIMLTLYFGLCPVLVMFALCSAKDGLFTGMLLLALLLLQELCSAPEAFFRDRGKVAGLVAATLFMMLLRHNGFYAFCVFGVICVLYLRKHFRKAALLFLAPIVLYIVVDAALAGIFHADTSENQEILTVPISQMARVYADQGESLPGQERALLERYLPQEALEKYTPKVSDGVKVHFDNMAYERDRAGFLKLWLKWGAEHPFTYLNAWFMTSYGFWYPDTVIDVYRGNTVFTYTYEDSSYFGYEVEEPGYRESKMPWLDECYRRMSLEIFQQKIPVVSMLFSPGFLFWVMLFLLGFLCYHGCWKRVVPFLFPLLCWFTVILGPTYLVRYVVFLWVAVPLLLWEAWSELVII